jgi:IclR family KDG regulon transcriptional repressor
MKRNSTSPGLVQSIVRSAEILKCIGKGNNRIVDISQNTNLGKSTVHRLLKTLEASGLVARDPINRQYQLGYIFIRLASDQTVIHQNLIVNALPEMKFLRDLSGETVTIQIPIGMQRMWLEELESSQNSKLKIGKGQVSSLIEGTGGQVLLSQYDISQFELILKDLKAGGMTALTINSLKTQVEHVRQQGYSLSINKELGSTSISVPLKNYACPVALNILGPINRFTNVVNIIPEMRLSADRISQKLMNVQAGKEIHRSHLETAVQAIQTHD